MLLRYLFYGLNYINNNLILLFTYLLIYAGKQRNCDSKGQFFFQKIIYQELKR